MFESRRARSAIARYSAAVRPSCSLSVGRSAHIYAHLPISAQTITLFDERERSAGPALATEDTFAFLNRAAGVVWARIRAELELWFADYPEEERSDLRGRFRSPEPDQHFGAWWELYLHRLWSRLGYRVAVHPDIPGQSDHPDFLVDAGAASFYVEAVAVFSGIVDPGRHAGREAPVQDAINAIDRPNFLVSLSFDRVGAQAPKLRAITRPIERWLDSLDPDEVLATAWDERPTLVVEVDDWVLGLEAHGVKPENRGQGNHRLIGMGPHLGGFVNDRRQLASALSRKKRQHGTPDRPLLIAALAVNGFMEDRDIAGALFGSESIRMEIATRKAWATRNRDGLWITERGVSGRRVSALLMGVGITPNACARTTPRVWYHPEPTYPLELALPFATARVVGSNLEWEDASAPMHEVLGLPADWPARERPFEG